MNKVAQIIKEVENASGSIAKASILTYNKDNELLKAVLKFIFDPYNKCSIGEAKLKKAFDRVTSGNGVTDPLQVIKYLTDNNTGSDAACNYAAGFIREIQEVYNDELTTKLAMALVLQDLKIGASVKTLNNIFGESFIPVVGCMLGTDYGKVNKPSWPTIVTEKLDGIRRILIKKNGKARMFSRSGHEDVGCNAILFEAERLLPDNFVYDGELLAIGDFKDNIAWRQATASIANSKGMKAGLSFNVFDMLPIEEFYAGRSKQTAVFRKIQLGAYFADEGIQYLTPDWLSTMIAFELDEKPKFIKAVPILGVAASMEDVTPIVDAIWKVHGEGVMLNSFDGLYEIKRSKSLMKVKFSEDKTVKVVDFIEGTGKYEDSLGALVVEYKGARVGVGSGLTDAERSIIWENKDKFLNQWVEIETFGESVNVAGSISLNCPIFKRFVGQEE